MNSWVLILCSCFQKTATDFRCAGVIYHQQNPAELEVAAQVQRSGAPYPLHSSPQQKGTIAIADTAESGTANDGYREATLLLKEVLVLIGLSGVRV